MAHPFIPDGNWIPRRYHGEVTARFKEFNLLKIDNQRELPLKSGGKKTDIYINMRNARSNPKALVFLADLFAPPMRLLGPDRFIEVPHSISCIAGPLSIATGIPYLTVREEEKEGRATTGQLIGECNNGESVVIFDDVITDGASKLPGWNLSRQAGLLVTVFLVGVDRLGGWKKQFVELLISAPVWAGMTLHDMRRELILSGAMQRCDPQKEMKNPIIVALDAMFLEEIYEIVDLLRTTGCILKVNDLAAAMGILKLLPELSVYGRVMLDLKSHDIGNTVANICRHLKHCAPWGMTFHASGGTDMIRAAKEAFLNHGINTKILGVTVLTSLKEGKGPGTCYEVYHRQPLSQVKTLAKIAMDAGADGLVCSPQEVRVLRNLYPNAVLITPGVRSPGQDTHDQARTDTIAGALQHGATHVVGGRQFTRNKDPVAEVNRVLTEELNIQL